MEMQRDLTRAVDASEFLFRDDGRTIEGKIVPYNTPTEIIELDPKTRELRKYHEQFLPRSCMAMAQSSRSRGNAGFIGFYMEHDESFQAKIGYATELRDEDDGAYATFRLYESDDLRKVQSMLRESHNGLSLKFADMKAPVLKDGIVSRVQVHIGHVAATPTPCYEHAGITAMRAVDGESFQVQTPLLNSVNDWLVSIGRKQET